MVRVVRARVTPFHPLARISRSTVHLATRTPCRRRCAQVFSDPYSDSGLRLPSFPGSRIARSLAVSPASLTARPGGGRDLRAQ